MDNGGEIGFFGQLSPTKMLFKLRVYRLSSGGLSCVWSENFISLFASFVYKKIDINVVLFFLTYWISLQRMSCLHRIMLKIAEIQISSGYNILVILKKSYWGFANIYLIIIIIIIFFLGRVGG